MSGCRATGGRAHARTSCVFLLMLAYVRGGGSGWVCMKGYLHVHIGYQAVLIYSNELWRITRGQGGWEEVVCVCVRERG